MRKIAIITGASAGMGAEFALQLDQKLAVDEFWLIARRADRLKELSERMTHPCRLFAYDITSKEFADVLTEALLEEETDLRMLVNNAGYGIVGNFAECSAEDATGMVELNCTALTRLTRLCLPYMRRNARIILAASSAAFVPQPRFAVYAATKAYVLSFGRALAAELYPKGIYVTSFCPGPVETEFFQVAERYVKAYDFKKYIMKKPQEVVAIVLRASVRKQPVVTPSLLMAAFRVAVKLIPHDLILLGMMLGTPKNEK